MIDITSINTALASIKAASDMVKVLKASTVSLKDAEQKFELANLIESLAEAKMSISETIDIIRKQDEKINELEAAFRLKSNLIRHKDVYYELVEGKPKGAPICSKCWEISHLAVHLTYRTRAENHCPNCKNIYLAGLSRTLE